ncbi:MAG: ABC transporter substrate-binding protein [Nocardioidaceae bacterium]|nr:ABC transporter substrate-binding protein [Nocardioidaceae bacterium]MCL2613379.1 ABC transporter substrate-binding protein [Nocardioidaceae bacterium]
MRRALAAVGASALALGISACGSGNGSSVKVMPDAWVLGTTDTVTALDPAGSYDLGSSTLEYNLYQTLVTVPANSTKIQGDAAKSCTYSDPKTLKCTLKPGLKFSNGDALTSADVKYSFERAIKIQDPEGAAIYLLGSITKTNPKTGLVTLDKGAIETPNDTTVVFHLNKPDTTFQYVLTYPGAAAIVDQQVFPAAKKLPDDQVIGSGRYKLAQYEAKNQAVLEKNTNYSGDNSTGASQVFIKYYSDDTALKLAVQNGEVDVAWRSLSPSDISDLKSDSKLTVATGQGAEIRYWTWKVDGPVGKNLAIRKAAAALIDRAKIAKVADDNTVTPLYSIVPPGYPGHKDSFTTAYGASPSTAKAKQMLQAAGVKTPVKLTVGWTPTHYGSTAEDEANELKRELEASGLFSVTLKSTEWEQYQKLYKQGAYDLFMLGWFPDYPDADDYLSPFLVNGGFFQNGYKNPTVNRLVAQEQGTADQALRQQIEGKLQDIAAKDVPLIPMWVGKNTAVYGKDMSGVDSTLDPSFIFRLWMVTKR